jgi:hypothetical protein
LNFFWADIIRLVLLQFPKILDYADIDGVGFALVGDFQCFSKNNFGVEHRAAYCSLEELGRQHFLPLVQRCPSLTKYSKTNGDGSCHSRKEPMLCVSFR